MTSKHPKRAEPFSATRRSHAQEAAEDYTELVAELILLHGEARTCDIAKCLGVSHVTALRTIRRLVGEGFLLTEPHRPVTLTPKGVKLASYCHRRHNIVEAFLLKIGVSSKVASIDAEGIEHHISDETLDCLERYNRRGKQI